MPGILDEIRELTDLLRCPMTGQRLHIATPEEVRSIPSDSGKDGDGFLVREDRSVAYPVRGGIPSLLRESMIPLDSPTHGQIRP